MTSIDIISKLTPFKKFKKPKTQLDYYKDNNYDNRILDIVELNPKTFGSFSEKITRFHFKMDMSYETSYDHLKNKKRIEQKSARFGKDGSLMWQHIELKHKWDFLLCMILNFNSFDYFITTRKNVFKMIKNNFITGQGKNKKPNQGYWFKINTEKKRKIFKKYFIQIINEKQLLSYICDI
tara:strand:+ start:1300 stop:1839 length:540 start_codon:yes stop_codon:yes gene_type:complete